MSCSSLATLGARCSERRHHAHLQIEPPCGRPVGEGLARGGGATDPPAMAWVGPAWHRVLHCQRLVDDWEPSVLLHDCVCVCRYKGSGNIGEGEMGAGEEGEREGNREKVREMEKERRGKMHM